MNQLKMEIKIVIKNVHLKKSSSSPEIICEYLETHNEIPPNPSPATVSPEGNCLPQWNSKTSVTF